MTDAGGALLVARVELLPELDALGYGPASDGGVVASALSGRRQMFELPLPSGGLVLRRFARGGLARHVRQGHSDPLRPFRELELSERLRAAGVATPRVALARARPRATVGWDLELGTERVPDAADAWEALVDAGEANLRRQLLELLGAGLATWFAAGLLHVDLNPRNVLFERALLDRACAGRVTDACGLWVIDLDRCRIDLPLKVRDRAAMFARAWRWAARRQAELCTPLTRFERARVVRDACGPDWREVWRASARIARREGPWRRLTRRFDDLLTRRSGSRRQVER